METWGWVAGSNANAFVTNHDTERVRGHFSRGRLFLADENTA
jgi:hypothetical protein